MIKTIAYFDLEKEHKELKREIKSLKKELLEYKFFAILSKFNWGAMAKLTGASEDDLISEFELLWDKMMNNKNKNNLCKMTSEHLTLIKMHNRSEANDEDNFMLSIREYTLSATSRV